MAKKPYRSKNPRSSTYRKRFIEANPGPWRCRYCNRPLDEGSMTVDHLVPIDAVSSGDALKRRFSHWALQRLGAGSVNDPVNLVPARRSCNSSKGPKVGLWTLRGILGRLPAYWAAIRAAQAALALVVVWTVAAGLARYFG